MSLYALLIGINDYERESVRNLRFAVADVLALRHVLTTRMGLDARNCMVLSHPANDGGASPRRAEVLRALARFSTAPMRPEDTFLLYFAGHGFAADNTSYLLTFDSNPETPELLEDTAIPLERVRQYTRRIQAGQQLLILDACRNEPTTLARGGASACLDQAMARDIVTLAREDRPGTGPRMLEARAILSACWEGQVSYEYAAGGQSWFCYNLLKSIQDYEEEEINVADLTERMRARMRETAWRYLPEAASQEPHVVIEGRPVRLCLTIGDEPPIPPLPPPRRLKCPACAQGLKVAAKYAGRRIRCRRCRQRLKVAEDLSSLTAVRARPRPGPADIWPPLARAPLPENQGRWLVYLETKRLPSPGQWWHFSYGSGGSPDPFCLTNAGGQQIRQPDFFKRSQEIWDSAKGRIPCTRDRGLFVNRDNFLYSFWQPELRRLNDTEKNGKLLLNRLGQRVSVRQELSAGLRWYQQTLRIATHPNLAVETDAYISVFRNEEAARNVELLVERRVPSLQYQRQRNYATEMSQFAKANVPEVWVIEVDAEEVVVYSRPNGGRYGSSVPYRRGKSLAPHVTPNVWFSVDELLDCDSEI